MKAESVDSISTNENTFAESRDMPDVVLIYAQACLAPEARQLAIRLERNVGGKSPLIWAEFPLESLHDHVQFQKAAEAAAQAGLILIASCGHEPPPARLLHWLEAVRMRSQAGKRALVELLGFRDAREMDLRDGAEAPLRAVAQRLGADYFRHQIILCPPCWRACQSALQQRAQTVSPLLANILSRHEPMPKCGTDVPSHGF